MRRRPHRPRDETRAGQTAVRRPTARWSARCDSCAIKLRRLDAGRRLRASTSGLTQVAGPKRGVPSEAIDSLVAQAGFAAHNPKFLPLGFSPVEGSVETIQGVRTLHLLYSDGVRTRFALRERQRAVGRSFALPRASDARRPAATDSMPSSRSDDDPRVDQRQPQLRARRRDAARRTPENRRFYLNVRSIVARRAASSVAIEALAPSAVKPPSADPTPWARVIKASASSGAYTSLSCLLPHTSMPASIPRETIGNANCPESAESGNFSRSTGLCHARSATIAGVVFVDFRAIAGQLRIRSGNAPSPSWSKIEIGAAGVPANGGDRAVQ